MFYQEHDTLHVQKTRLELYQIESNCSAENIFLINCPSLHVSHTSNSDQELATLIYFLGLSRSPTSHYTKFIHFCGEPL